MKGDSPAIRVFRWSLIGLGILLPVATLIPLGSLWLWQNGWLPAWAIVACCTTVAAWIVQRWLLRPRRSAARQQIDAEAAGDTAADGAPGARDPSWTPAETAAWEKVEGIANSVDPDALNNREAVLALGMRTIETVALSLNPEKRDPLLQFTAPEALALVERVSGRMNAFFRDNIPLGDRLTVAQVMMLYRWRGTFEWAERAYDIWRALRLLNPATAITSEIRERLSKEMMAWGKQHITRRLAQTYVEEVGRAAIDLYGGRLKVTPERLSEHVSSRSARDLEISAEGGAEPLRLIVAGQVSAGKSSLVNALAKEVQAAVDALPATNQFTPYRLQSEGLPAALIVDSPGLSSEGRQVDALVEQVADSDLLLWVAAANRADREVDRAALEAVRRHFAERPNRRRPPMLLVLSHVDRLRPFNEWSPPYDLNDAASPKAASMRAAVEAAAVDLGFQATDVIPACLLEGASGYNVETIWAQIMEALPDAQRARLVRMLRDADRSWSWQTIWSQAKSGGRVLAKTALR